jgi:hypothetical protein
MASRFSMIAGQVVQVAGGRETRLAPRTATTFLAGKKVTDSWYFCHAVCGFFLEGGFRQFVPNCNRHVGAPFCAVDVVCNLGNAAGISSLAARENVEGA